MQDRTSYLGESIRKTWEKEIKSCTKRNNRSKPLLKVLLRCFGKPYLLIGIAEGFMELFSRMYQPLLLANLLRYFASNREEWDNKVYYCAAGIILLSFIDTFITHYTIHYTMHIGLKIRIACNALIYQKILKLSNSVLSNETSTGQMINFLSSDITRLESSLWDLHYIWIAPIQIVLITYIIFSEIGWSAVIGMSMFLLFIPFQHIDRSLLAKKMAPLTLKSAERSDDRLRLMNQVITGMQVIKMYVWEIPFYNLVETARKREMSVIKKYSILKQVALTFDCYVPRLCLFITILAYILFGNYINAETVYLVTAYYNVLRNSMIFGFSMAITQLLLAKKIMFFISFFVIYTIVIIRLAMVTQNVSCYYKLHESKSAVFILYEEKTRILVTHQLQYLHLVDHIIVMNNGSIEQQGTFDQLQAMGLDFMKVLKATDAKSEETKIEHTTSRRRSSAKYEINDNREISDIAAPETYETRAKGRMSSAVFFAYFKASKKPLIIALMMLLFILNQIISGGSDYFVAFWVNVESNSWQKGENDTMEFLWEGMLSRDSMIYIYSAMIAVIILLWQLQTIVYFTVCMWSSINLHSAMFHSILRTTMYFYNTNPAGRILNRFARDINIVDLMLSMCIFDIIVIGLISITVIVMIVAVTPWLAIPTIICGCIFIYLRMIYICTSRSIKRLEGTTRSPIFDLLGASLQGLTTIRASNAEEILMADLCNHQDLNSSAGFLFMSTSRAFGFYLDLLCQLYIGVVIVIFTAFDGLAVVGNIGLTITQIMGLTNMLQWGVRQTAELESQLTSIERILEYSHLQEEPMIDSKPETKPPDDWPTKGHVEFKDVSLKYSPTGIYVLRNISFNVMPKEKIGIVGRTGAGKSSLINALFRLACVEGEIYIDKVSTDAIALHDFRSKISIIPQEPFLFTGSLRQNLDPFDQYSDAVLWQALQDVELKETISEMAAGLNTKVSDEGSNFSVGQRQLLCLARAIIRNNRIMVLDEATANIDPYTDSLIQKTVRTKFLNCTVFTIAHRLNTIMDNDRIIVMNAGCLVEFDHPYVLLQLKGWFYSMVQQTGVSMAKNLVDIATKVSENSVFMTITIIIKKILIK
ncbi:putative multidrug resistance-associated protein [Ooceraea biroi]|uniref:Putative multidrug resistance-associated protein n=2 Tax=Ooceraea biroi TaxID=2015173 RepID=A0A026VTR9_OOCBI|nr:putative multidrug resistance-associated protein [Ooceraea biroi]